MGELTARYQSSDDPRKDPRTYVRSARTPAVSQTEAIATLKPLFCLPLFAHIEIITPLR